MYLSNKLLNNNQGRREGGKFIYKIMQKIVAKKRQCAKMGFYYRQRGQKCWHNSFEKFWRPIYTKIIVDCEEGEWTVASSR